MENIFKPNIILKQYLEEHDISQADLIRLCEEKGHAISQANLSKVLSNQKKMSVEECISLCTALDISADKLLLPDSYQSRKRSEVFFSLTAETILSMKGLLGEYHIMYESTAAEENGSLIDGSLKLYQENQFVYARIIIHAGQSVVKKYEGQFVISQGFPTAYIIVKNNETGEVCMAALRFRPFNVENMQCRMALCLTTSAGEKRQPIAHRMILVRKERFSEKETYENLKKSVSSFLKEERGFQLEREEDMALFQVIQKIKENENV